MAGNRYDAALDELLGPDLGRPYGVAVDEVMREQSTALKTAVQAGAQTTPDRAAQVLDLSQRTALPPRVVDQHFDELSRRVRVEATDYDRLLTEHPKLAEWMAARPEHAALARDDREGLSRLDRILVALERGARRLAQVPRATQLDINARILRELDAIEARLTAGERPEAIPEAEDPFGHRWRTPEERARLRAELEANIGTAATRIAQREAEIQALPEDPDMARFAAAPTFAEKWAIFSEKPIDFILRWGAESAPLMVPGVAGALVAGPAGGAGAAAGALGLGSAQVEYASAILHGFQAEGVDITDPAAIEAAVRDRDRMARIGRRAFARAMLVGGFDVASGGVAGRTLAPARLAARPALREAVNQPAQMVAQGALGAAGEAAATLATGEAPDVGELMAEFFGEFATAPVEVGTMAAAGARARLRERLAAKEREALFRALGEGVSASKTFQRLPEAVQDLVARLTADGPVMTLYQPLEDWDAYWREQDRDPRAAAADVIGDGGAAYDEAVAAGTDLPIPTAAYAAKLAGTPHHAAFARTLRTAPDAMNAVEAEAFAEEAEAALAAEPVEAPTDPAARVREDVLGQLLASGTERSMAETYATLYAQRYAARAARLGGAVDAFQLYARNRLRIERPLPEVLRRPETLEGLDALLDRLRAGDIPSERETFGPSLLEALREVGLQGGVGEVDDLEINAQTRRVGQRNIVRDDGLTLDRAAEWAAERGYLAERDIDALLDAIREELAGRPTYARGQENPRLVETRQALEELDAYLRDAGLDVQRLDNAAIKAALEGRAAPAPADAAQGEPALTLEQADRVRGEIRALVAAAEGPRGPRPAKVVVVSAQPWLAEAAQQAGLRLAGFRHVIDEDAVRHILKEHGDPDTEAARGQVAVRPADLEAIPEILTDPDQVILGRRTRKGDPQIVYLKHMGDGSTVYLEQVRRGRRELATITMWKYPAVMNAASVLAALDPNARGGGGDTRIVLNQPARRKPPEPAGPSGGPGVDSVREPLLEGYGRAEEPDRLPPDAGDDPTARPPAAPVVDVDGATTVHRAPDPDAEGRFATVTATRQAGRLTVQRGGIRTAADVASALAQIRKAPQEQVVALVLDEAGQPLEIIRHQLGDVAEAGVNAGILAGSIHRIRGAAQVWLAHNHPSGSAFFSEADIQITRRVANVLRGSGVELRGMLAIGITGYAVFDPATNTREEGKTIPPVRRTTSAPVTERVFRRRDKLSEVIGNSAAARAVVRELAGDTPGVVLLDQTHRAVAFVPMPLERMARLRQPGGVDTLARAIERSNAAAAIISLGAHPLRDPRTRRAMENMAGFLKAAKIRALDAIANGVSAKTEGFAVEGPIEFQQTAFHGSGALFDRFSLEFIGTGEGAQAFGWGLYFASRKEIGEFYRDKLSRAAVIPDEVLAWYFTPGRVIPGYGGMDRVVAFHPAGEGPLGSAGWSVTVQRVERNAAGEWVPVYGERPRRHATYPDRREVERALRAEGREDLLRLMRPGRLYTVEIPEDDQYLDWDKPLSEQPGPVKAILRRLRLPVVVRGLDSWASGAQARAAAEQIGLAPDGYTIEAFEQEESPIAPGAPGPLRRHRRYRVMVPVLAPARQSNFVAVRVEGASGPLGPQNRTYLYPIEGAEPLMQLWRDRGYRAEVVEDAEVTHVRSQGEAELADDVTGEALYNAVRADPDDAARWGVRADSQEAASRTLAKHGIAGIRYLDATSRARGEGSRNYVVFDDRLIQIVEYEQRQAVFRGAEIVEDLSQFRRSDGPDDYLYHVTTRERAERIMAEGFRETGQRTVLGGLFETRSRGRAFFTERDGVRFWRDRIEAHLEAQSDDPVPPLVAIRIPAADIEHLLQEDEVGTRDARAAAYFVELAALDEVLEQRAGTDPRGAILFGPDRAVTIRLYEKADLSTFLHESGHLWLEELIDDATLPEAPEALRADLDRVLEWFGLSVRAADGAAAVRAAITREHHEQWARGFEAYLMEGKAPSVALRSVFAKFRGWLVALYRSLTRLNVTLTDEVRGVMDRLLATDEAIVAAEAEAQVTPLFADPAAAGMTETEFQAYRATVEAASREAREELEARLLAEYRREQAAWWKERRAEVEAEVAAEVYADPVYIALAWLRSGTQPDGSPLPEGQTAAKLDAAALEAVYGKASRKPGEGSRVMNRLLQLGVYARDGGIPPEAAAELLGFPSADALVMALVNARPMREVIQAETDVRMRERYGDLLSHEAELIDAARAAVHGEGRQKVLQAELRALRKKAREVQPFVEAERRAQAEARQRGLDLIRGGVPDLAVIRRTAASLIARQRVRDLQPHRYLVAARRQGAVAVEAAAAGDYARAAKAKSQQLLSTELYREATRVRAEVDQIVAELRGYSRPATRARLAKAGGEYLAQIEALLERFDLGRVSRQEADRRSALAAWIAKQEAAGQDILIDERLRDEAFRTPYVNLTVETLRGLKDSVRHLAHLATVQTEILTAKAERELEAALDTAEATIFAFAPKRRPPTLETRLPGDETRRLIGGFFASHRKFASLIRQMDGFEDGGLLWNLLVRPLNEAATREAVMTEAATRRLQELFAPYIGDPRLYRKVHIPAINRSLTHMGRLMVALNWGNLDNRRKLMDGYQWTEPQVQAILEGLSEADWQFVQGVWDFIDSYWPEIKAKQERVDGLAPEKVEAAPVQTPYGTFRGGYFPLKYDDRQSPRAYADAAKEAAEQALRGAFARATTRRGHTKARVEGVRRPIRLDFGVIFEHVYQVIHDLTHHETLIDLNRILGHERIQKAIFETYGDEVYRQLQATIQDVAAGDVPAQRAFEKFINWLRQGSSIATMAWNVTTGLVQPLGLTQSIVRIGPRWVARGLSRWVRDAASMEHTVRWIHERSDFMRLRAKTQQREIAEIRNRIGVDTGRVRGWLGQVVDAATLGRVNLLDVQDSYFWFITRAQMVADVPTWLGAYEKAHAEGADEATAIARADQAVLDAQGGGQVKDLASIQRGGPLLRLWTNFYSYFNTTWNLTVESVRAAQLRSAQVRALGIVGRTLVIGRLLVDLWLLYSAPVLLAYALREALRGGEDDDEALAVTLAREHAGYLMGTLVGLRELSGPVQGFHGYEGPAGARFFGQAARLVQQVEQGEMDAALLRAANQTAGVLLHYPAGQVQRTVEGFVALHEGETANPAVLVTGPARR